MNTLTQKNKKRIHNITKIAILSAIAAILMLFEFPLPFAPFFYELNLSEVVILMGGFAMGPVAAALIELIKILINLIINGTSTAYIGEIANFLMGCSLVVPAALIYKYKKTFKGALAALGVGGLSLVVVSALLNYFVMIPAFSYFYHLPVEDIIAIGSEVNFFVKDLKSLVLFAVVPFNLVKGLVCAVLNLLLYKRVSKILHI